MKDFLKFTLATITGIIVSSVILFFLSIMVLFSMASSSESETQVRKNSVMMLNLNGTLNERSQEIPFDFLMGNEYKSYGMDDILASIKKAKEHEDIKGIYLEATSLNAGVAACEEIRNALKEFKTSGKFIVAYSDNYTQGLYYLSSVADKVLMNPQGMIEWNGLSSTPVFFKDLLEKIGVEMQIFKVGTYKSAVEPFISTEMSPANREQINAYLTSIWGQITSDVAESRNVSVESLNAIADRMLMFHPAEESVKCGLVDTLIYKNDVQSYLKTMVGIDKDDSMPVLGLQDMINVKKNVPKDKSGNIIAVYYAYGDICNSASSDINEQSIDATKVIKDLQRLKENKDVKAVVLRVNSPGGSAFASEQIWYAVSELKKEKPVIVSMGDYAASGGYYISCNADT
ncbi:MAG: S49 family peptidase, partial [Bacteroides sp.]|nr:S49 family peptidase [Bacteroides sp.]